MRGLSGRLEAAALRRHSKLAFLHELECLGRVLAARGQRSRQVKKTNLVLGQNGGILRSRRRIIKVRLHRIRSALLQLGEKGLEHRIAPGKVCHVSHFLLAHSRLT